MTVFETCDTSVLVPALLSWHPEHESARTAVLSRVHALPAHVLLETYSVLTRLPAPHRVDPATAASAIGMVRRRAVGLPAEEHQRLVGALAGSRIRGGAIYDALIAATARHNDLILLTRDRRARQTYDSVGVRYMML